MVRRALPRIWSGGQGSAVSFAVQSWNKSGGAAVAFRAAPAASAWQLAATSPDPKNVRPVPRYRPYELRGAPDRLLDQGRAELCVGRLSPPANLRKTARACVPEEVQNRSRSIPFVRFAPFRSGVACHRQATATPLHGQSFAVADFCSCGRAARAGKDGQVPKSKGDGKEKALHTVQYSICDGLSDGFITGVRLCSPSKLGKFGKIIFN